jgi:hypothetical protein
MKSTISKAIDPSRVGISKSTIVAASLCQRKAFFGERVRDKQGRRVQVPMPERVLFGVAIDNAVQHVLWNIREGTEWSDELLDEAVIEGLGAMESRLGADELDPVAIQEELQEALFKFKEQVLDADILTPRKGVMMLQGMDGESLRYGDLIGTPDIIQFAPWAAIIDVKSSPKSKSQRDLYSAEMAHYATMYLELFGKLPVVAYLTWVRTQSDRRWQYVGMQSTVMHTVLAEGYRSVTRGLLESETIDRLPFNTQFCGSCEWKSPRPELGFGGCQIGQSVASMEAR